MDKISGYLRLMRPANSVMMGFAVITGAALASFKDLGVLWLSLMYGFITGVMLTAASMGINDYFDRQIDAVNEPNRPIPSGAIKPKEALVFALILTILGFSTAYLTSMLCLLVAGIAWIIFVTYTTVGKRSGLPGNFLVSSCVAIPFVYGSVAVTGSVKLNVLVFASIAFLSNSGREITKGIVDIQGDRAQNVRTLAMLYNEKVAAFTAAFFYLAAVLLSPIPWLLHLVSLWFIPLAIVTDLGLIVATLMLLRDHSREGARKVKKIVLLFLFTGLLAFFMGVLG